jgi:hypothetical protein
MSLYLRRSLLETNPAVVKSLAKAVWEKARNCAICEATDVSVWIFDVTNIVMGGCVVFARLLCNEHFRKWQNHETLSFRKLNGVLLLDMPCAKPIRTWTNMPWNDFENFMATHSILTVDFIRDSFQKLFSKTTDILYRGEVDDLFETSS